MMWKLSLAILCATALVNAEDDSRQKAALIVGGYWPSQDGTQPITAAVELFGCAGAEGQSIPLPSFPTPTYLAGGMHFHDDNPANEHPHDGVLVCGGYRCGDDGLCTLSPECSIFYPEYNNWTTGIIPDMPDPRWAFLLAHGPNAKFQDGEGDTHPIVVGYYKTSAIYSRTTQLWDSYLEIPNNWFTMNCFVQDHNNFHEDHIYYMGTNIYRINITTWDIQDLGKLPTGLQNPGKCAAVEIGGERGIFNRLGLFYKFSTGTWTRYASPPANAIAAKPNALFTFNNKPTIFGNPRCDNDAVCIGDEVWQFDANENKWNHIGNMTRPRRFHEVIEVDGDFCDFYVDPTSTVITEPTETTTKETTQGTTKYSPGTTTVTQPSTDPPATTTDSASLNGAMKLLSAISVIVMFLNY